MTSILVSLCLIVWAVLATRKLRVHPTKGQIVLESLIALPYTFVLETLGSEKVARKVFPVIMTVFLFILCANWFGLLPFVGAVGFFEGAHFTPLFYPVHTDLNITFALALIAFITIEYMGIAALGFFRYAGKFVTFKSPIAFFVGLIELISEVARLISFSFRLFGNIFAGKVLILVAMAFVPLILPIPLIAFEVLVGFIQAAIFAILILFFVKVAVTDEAH